MIQTDDPQFIGRTVVIIPDLGGESNDLNAFLSVALTMPGTMPVATVRIVPSVRPGLQLLLRERLLEHGIQAIPLLLCVQLYGEMVDLAVAEGNPNEGLDRAISTSTMDSYIDWILSIIHASRRDDNSMDLGRLQAKLRTAFKLPSVPPGGEPAQPEQATAAFDARLHKDCPQLGSVVLPAFEREELLRFVQFVQARTDAPAQFGLDPTIYGSIAAATLFSGPSGTGKSMAGGAIARELGLNHYVLKSNMLMGDANEQERQLQQVFDEISSRKGVFQIDEVDRVLHTRRFAAKADAGPSSPDASSALFLPF
jgi:hypothetical protein